MLAGRAAWRWQGAIAALALIALVVPRLITAAPLDLLAAAHAGADPAEDAGENFPGSAYFFAQGALVPAAGAATLKSEHVLGLEAVQAAPAMAFRGLTAVDSYRALNCLTSAIYYEAGNEPEEGQRAVAQVVLNRVRHPNWPKSVCGVVYEGSERTDLRCQFTFSCDGSMARRTIVAAWARSRRIAEQALAGKVYEPVGLATFYHTLAVRPLWAAAMRPVAVIGAHIFYRSSGAAGMPGAFRSAYLGREFQSGPALRPLPIAPVISAAAAWTSPASGQATQLLPQPEPSVPRPVLAIPQPELKPEYRNSGRPVI
ncbi:cell wall hydrolase [Sphingobium bisphenolivorans]|uniref:cell wall hydrolase n=1 Tax=Sphingobium bisphenolivorans TaxID=1335760 RepID=UPI000488C1DC|nr:cell wall hydrolase [Sphingobium bisphenolivorans]